MRNFVSLLGMPPCGAGEGEVFFPAMERTKDRRGTAPMSAYAQRALIEGGPQRIFGYFLCEQKVTTRPPHREKLKNLSTF